VNPDNIFGVFCKKESPANSLKSYLPGFSILPFPALAFQAERGNRRCRVRNVGIFQHLAVTAVSGYAP
jgi:hypothetical protein